MLKKNIFSKIMLCGAVLLALACDRDSTFRGWEFMPDMYRGPALETYEPYGRFADSSSARLPVKGTVPRNFMAYQEFSAEASGYDSARAMLTMPESIPTDSVSLARGQEIYGIFCDHCHGDNGAGQGILVERGKYVGVPSYADRALNLGTVFHVVTYGKGVMGSHASQITPRERWEVSQYVMKLKEELAAEAGGDEEQADDAEQESADNADQETNTESTQG